MSPPPAFAIPIEAIGKRLIAAFFGLPKVLQWAAISITKSIVASWLMSVVAVYATAFFALRHGFRVPIEGTPSLGLAVAAATFVTFAGTLLVFGVILSAGQFMAESLDQLEDKIRNYKTRYENITDALRSDPKNYIKIISKAGLNAFVLYINIFSLSALWLALIFIVKTFKHLITAASWEILFFIIYIFSIISMFNSDLFYIFTFLDQDRFFKLSILLMFLSIFMLCVRYALVKGTWVHAQIYASLLVFIAMAALIFVDDIYGSFLRITRFGGGIEGVVEYKADTASSETFLSIHCYILIISDEELIGLRHDNEKIFEIPRKNINNIYYSYNPEWKLPNYKLRMQKKYFDINIYQKS